MSDLDLPLGAKDIELLEQISPGDAEILDTSLSTNLDRERSGLRARLQMQAYEIRPLLRQADQGYNTFRINGDSTGFIYETTDPAKANHLIAELGNVQIREVQVSEAHLESIVEAIQETLGEPGPLQPLDSLWVDKSINKVIVGVQPDKKILVEGILDRSNIASELIDVTISEIVPREEVTYRGGINASTCTWGFTVYYQGQNHLTTAGHCGSSQSFAGTNLAYVAGSEVNSGNVDMQLHKITSGTVENEIYKGGNPTYRTISNTRNWAANDVDDVTCHRGKATGYNCGSIVSVTGAQVIGGGIRVLRSDVVSGGGDSGGPYVFGSTALGTHEGNDGNAVWTTIQYSQEYYPISVRTN